MPKPTTLRPSRVLGGSPLGQGGQILAFAVAPRAERLAVLGNHHVISVVDVAAGRIVASLPCQSALQFVAFDGDDHLLAWDHRGLVRLTLTGASRVVIDRPWGGPDAFRAQDVLLGGDTLVLLESRGYPPEATTRAQVYRGGAPVATIDYSLADHAAALGLADIGRSALVVNAAGLSPDGRRLVMVASVVGTFVGEHGEYVESTHGVVLIHDGDGRLLHVDAFVRGSVGLGNDLSYFPHKVAFSPDGRRFVTGRWPVRVFDSETGAVVSAEMQIGGQPVELREVIFLANGELAVAGERCVGRWSPGASEALAVHTFRERAFVLAMAATRTAIAVADDRALLLFSLPDLAPMHEAIGHTKSVSLLALDAPGASVASSDGASLIVWDAATGAPRFRIATRAWAGLAFSPDGRELMTPIDSMRPHVLDAGTGEVRAAGKAFATAIQWTERSPRCLHYEEVMRDDGCGAEIVVSDGREARETARFPGPYFRCVPALARDGRRALFWADTVAYAWDLERGRQLWSRPLDVCQAALSPDGAFALVTRIGGPPIVLDMTTGEQRFALTAAGDTISWAVAWSAAGDRLAVGSGGADVWLFDIDDPAAKQPRVRATRLQTDHRPQVASVAFSGDGMVLATGGAEGSVKVFELGPPEPFAPRPKTSRPA